MTYNKIYRVPMFLLLQLNWLLFGRFWKVGVLFLVYPGTPADSKAYGPDWFLKWFLSLVFPIGLVMRDDRPVGLVMACAITTGDFEGDAALLQEVMDRLQKIAQQTGAEAVALAGRMPSIAARHRLPINLPFVHGTMGTLFAVNETVKAVLAKHDRVVANTTVVVVGVGYTGRELMRLLSRQGFRRVIGYDKIDRSADLGDMPSNVTFSMDPAVLADADIVVILTEKGEQIAPLISYIREDAIVVDDTHPQLPRSIREALAQACVTVYKVAVRQDGGTHMHPQLPGYPPGWLPGCLVEALVVASNDGVVVTDYTHFAQLARAIGLHALLVSNHYER